MNIIKKTFAKITGHPIKIVFSYHYIGIPASDSHGSFDVTKYKKIKDLLIAEKILRRNQMLIPEMVSYSDIELVHSKLYIKNIQNPVNVARYLHVGHVNPWDSYILEFFRIVTGGTVLATEYAFSHRGVVFNLGGGFHHAQSDKAAGFCLLNDVAIAIQRSRKLGLANRFLIIDLDYHQGDGILYFFKNDNQVYTFSINASQWIKIDKKNNTELYVQNDCSGKNYLELLKKNLDGLCMNFRPDLVFYIAGSDTYEKDTIGDMNLSRSDMLSRNMYVYKKIIEQKIPLVVLAGGGYGPHSWEVYYDFLKEALKRG